MKFKMGRKSGVAGLALLMCVGVGAPAYAAPSPVAQSHAVASQDRSAGSSTLPQVEPTDALGVIASLASAVSKEESEQQALADLQQINVDFQTVQQQLNDLRAALNTDFEQLLEADEQQTYELAADNLQNMWVFNIDGALAELQNMLNEAQAPNPNPQLMADYVSDFQNYVAIGQTGSLNEAGNALMQGLIYNSGTSSPPLWGLAWQLIRQDQLIQYGNTLLTSNSSSQFQAMSNGWLGLMAALELVLSNYWNFTETPAGSLPTAQSQAAAADDLQASGIAAQIEALQAAQPALIPDNVLVDPSTQLMWGNFGPQLVGSGDNLSPALPPTSTNAAGEQTGLGDLLNQINGTETLAQGGWNQFPAGVAGKGSGPAGSGLQISDWSFPEMYAWAMPNGDLSYTEHGNVQFGGNGYTSGLESQLQGVAPGQSMMNAFIGSSSPSLFPTANPSNWDFPYPSIWVYTNDGYQQMMPNAESQSTGEQLNGIVGSPVAWCNESLYHAGGSILLKTIVNANDYQWVQPTAPGN